MRLASRYITVKRLGAAGETEPCEFWYVGPAWCAWAKKKPVSGDNVAEVEVAIEVESDVENELEILEFQNELPLKMQTIGGHLVH